LDIKNLVNLTSKVIATQISAKSGEDLKETFNSGGLEDLAALESPGFATRTRLHKKLQRKEIMNGKSGGKRKGADDVVGEEGEGGGALVSPAEVGPLPPDNRSLDDLMAFIGEDTAPTKKKKKKKKKDKSGAGAGTGTPPSPSRPPGADTGMGEADSTLIDQRRAAAKAKLAATSAADIVWADSGDEDETELDQEVQDFRIRLQATEGN
jgi:hypothetical protein